MNVPDPLEWLGSDILRKADHSREDVEGLIDWLASLPPGGDRAAAAAAWFCRCNVPFKAEAHEVHDAPNQFPTFSSFDCATFAYAVNALAAANSADDYLSLLDAVRYCGPRSADSLIHYTLNSLAAFASLRILDDITATLIDPRCLDERTVLLDDRGEGRRFIERERIGDANRGLPVSYRYIPSRLWTARMPGISNGDTLIFVSSKPRAQYPGIVAHIGIAWCAADGVSMIHGSKSPVGRRDGRAAGVSLLRHWDPVNQGLLEGAGGRTVSDYLHHNPELFVGVGVFRPRGGDGSRPDKVIAT